MSRFRLLVPAFALAFAGPLGAALPAYRLVMTPEEGPVDRVVEARYTPALAACQSAAVSTDDNASCFQAEFARQDAKLNLAWRAAYAPRAPQDKVALLAAQRRWLAERDPFCRKVTGEFAGGTIMSLIWHNCRAEQTIRRTLWLEALARH